MSREIYRAPGYNLLPIVPHRASLEIANRFSLNASFNDAFSRATAISAHRCYVVAGVNYIAGNNAGRLTVLLTTRLAIAL